MAASRREADGSELRWRNSQKQQSGKASYTMHTNSNISDGMSLPQEAVPAVSKPWPEGCRYFNRKTVSLRAMRHLLDQDTLYCPGENRAPLSRIDFSHGNAHHYPPHLRPEKVIECLSEGEYESCRQETPETAVLLVDQRKLYGRPDSISRITISKDLWLSVLAKADVLPSFLEVIHTNNSGFVRHFSYGSGNRQDDVEAYHLSVKVGSFLSSDFAIYARQDLRTGRLLVLFVGSSPGLNGDSIGQRLQGAPNLNMFDVVLAFLEHVYHKIDAKRVRYDFNTQELERRTGHAPFFHQLNETVPVSNLTFSKDLQRWAGLIRGFIYGCDRFVEMIEFLQLRLTEYHTLVKTVENLKLSTADLEALKSAFEQKRSLISGHRHQSVVLLNRVEAQISVTRSLLADRDTEATIEIAKATKQDGAIMRGIAFVTMVFLPATFAATFFSMVFFHVGDEQGTRLTVERHIWLYPALTVPITLAIMLWYWGRYRALPSVKGSMRKGWAILRSPVEFLKAPSRHSADARDRLPKDNLENFDTVGVAEKPFNSRI